MKSRVKRELGKIRPALKRDGGDVKFVSVSNDGVVKVRMLGACSHCPAAAMTVKGVIERRLKKAISEVKKVISI
ncbi:MAG: NifU family protein [Anaerolineae bacterium]|nr:NifU family protein [Anaerolineae bacterium]